MSTLLSYCIQVFQGWFQGQPQNNKSKLHACPAPGLGKVALVIQWVLRLFGPGPVLGAAMLGPLGNDIGGVNVSSLNTTLWQAQVDTSLKAGSACDNA